MVVAVRGHPAPPVVYASLAAVVTSVPLTILRIEHRARTVPLYQRATRLRSITYPVCIAVAAPQRCDRRWIFERPRIILPNLRPACKNMCYINDTLFLRGTQPPKSFWHKTFWRDAPGMSVYNCATVHLNFQNSTENANAFVCSDPAFVRLQKSLVQKINLSNLIGTSKFVN